MYFFFTKTTLHLLANWSLLLDFKQPHLQRTNLCDMKDSELDPSYVKKRDKLKELVASLIRPKIVQGKSLNGKEFVSFLEQVLGFACLGLRVLHLLFEGMNKSNLSLM